MLTWTETALFSFVLSGSQSLSEVWQKCHLTTGEFPQIATMAIAKGRQMGSGGMGEERGGAGEEQGEEEGEETRGKRELRGIDSGVERGRGK